MIEQFCNNPTTNETKLVSESEGQLTMNKQKLKKALNVCPKVITKGCGQSFSRFNSKLIVSHVTPKRRHGYNIINNDIMNNKIYNEKRFTQYKVLYIQTNKTKENYFLTKFCRQTFDNNP